MHTFKVGDRVKRTTEVRIGTIIAINIVGRCQVLWDAVPTNKGEAASHYHRAKKTWLQPKSLILAKED
jgi:hypothetical protein